MSINWTKDIADMHQKFGVNDWVYDKLREGDYETLRTFLKFRIDFLREELEETEDAFVQGDPKEIVDGLIDLCVIAIGTLDAFGADANAAWDEVFRANYSKEVGVKPGRPNPLGLPDLIKPEGWVGPDHEGSDGALELLFKDERKITNGH